MIAAGPASAPGRTSRLRLGALDVSLRVHPPAEAHRLAPWADGGAFARDSAAVLEETLDALLDDADPSVWIVRRLELGAFVQGGREGTLAGFAFALREAIARALRGEDGGGVLRFPSRAAYLAVLLADLARGDAHARWYHFRVRHLAPLPVADALAQVFAAHVEAVPEALALMREAGSLDPLLTVLGERGARRLIALLAGPREAIAVPASARPLFAPAAASAAARRWGPGPRAMLALLATTGPRAGPSPAAILAAAEQAIAAGTPPSLRRPRPAARGRGRDLGGRKDRGAPPRLKMAAPTNASRAPAIDWRTIPAPDAGEEIETPFAGLFLLWRSVVALGLPDLLPAGRARLTLAAALAGRDWRPAFADPALHWLTGFAPGENGRRSTPPPGLAAAFAAHMGARAAPERLRLVEQREAGRRVVQDLGSEDWIAFDGPPVPPAGPKLRPIVRDLHFFGLDRARPAHRPPFALLARAAYGDLGRRLGLPGSSAAWLRANVVAGWGRLELGAEAELTLPRAPLDLMLRMTGLDGTLVVPPDGPCFRLRLPQAR